MDAAPGAPRDLNPAAPPPVTVGLVTFNAAGLLPRTLPRLLAVTQYPAVRWLVVDNASADGTADLLARDFPAVQVERLPANLGSPAAVTRRAWIQSPLRGLHPAQDIAPEGHRVLARAFMPARTCYTRNGNSIDE